MKFKSVKFIAAAAGAVAVAMGLVGAVSGNPLFMYASCVGLVGVAAFLAIRGYRYMRVALARNGRMLHGQKAVLNELDDHVQAAHREQSALVETAVGQLTAKIQETESEQFGTFQAELKDLNSHVQAVRREQSALAGATRVAEAFVGQLTHEKNKLQQQLKAAQIGAKKAESSVAGMSARLQEAEAERSRVAEDARKIQQELAHAHKAELKKVSSEAQAKGVEKFKADTMAAVSPFGASWPKVSAPFGFSPDAFYGAQHHKDIRILERIAMKMGSLRAREAIALSATAHQHSLNEVLLMARSCHFGMMDKGLYAIVRSWNVRALLSLARVLADQSLVKNDQSDAVALYEMAIAAFGIKNLDERARYILLETLQTLGLSEKLSYHMEAFDLAQHDDVQTALLKCNEIMRHKDSAGGTPETWFEHLNEVYVRAGLAPISHGYDDPDLLDTLETKAPRIEDGPLVSIMMATHNGSERIGTAIRSITGQSWRNLELIIVDDFSDDEHWRALQEHAKSDSRVRVYRMDSNQGAYRARNFAFSKTRGEFVTVHDDDDWSHSQKIEIQVRHLLENPEVVGNMSFQTRIDENYQFLRINDNPRFNQRNYSSMMVRRELVTQLGGWDDINRAADAEFHDRVRVVTGQSIVGVETPPLSFMRARSGSLTSGEIQKGALDFARQTYGLLYSAWHKSLAQLENELGALKPLLTDPKHRPFVVPDNMLPGRRNAAFEKFDVIFVTDFRFPGGNSSLIAAEIATASKAGLYVGIAQLDSPVLRAPHAFSPAVHEVVARHNVPVLTLKDEVKAGLVVVRNPTVLQYAERLRSTISTDNLAIIVNTAPLGRNGSNFCYDLNECETAAEGMFGVKPVVYPESPQTRALNEALFPDVNYAKDEWTGFIDPCDFELERDPAVSRRPVVGRHSRDHALKWPDTIDDIRHAYVQPDTFDTRILGGAESIQEILDLSDEPNVTVLPFGSEEPKDFLKSIDFWVYQHSSKLTESFGMAALEGLASGAVVILPPYMENLFGDAALYAAPDAIPSIVRKYWDDPELYRAQSTRAVETVRARFSSSAFVDKLSRLTGKSSAGAVEAESHVSQSVYV